MLLWIMYKAATNQTGIYANWQVDNTNVYQPVACEYTYVPDDNFEQALIDSGIDTDGMINDQVLTTDV